MSKNEKINYNNIFLAIFIGININALALNKILKIDNLIVLISVVCLSCFVINLKLQEVLKKENLFKFCIVFFIMIIFLINIFFTGIKSSYYLLNFICFGITAFLASLNKFDVKIVIKNIVLNYIILIPIMYNIKFVDMQPEQKMGAGYLFLLGILTAITYLKIDKKNIYRILSILNIIFYGGQLIEIGSRGPMIILVIFITYIFYNNLRIYTSKILFLVFSICVSVYSMKHFSRIISNINLKLVEMDIDIKALNHMQNLIEKEDLMNGRTYLYKNTIEKIFEKPLLGTGIGGIEINNHPHNFILHILVEFGVVIGFIFFLLVIFKIIKMIKTQDLQIKTFLIILFCLAPVKLMFSSQYWIEQNFWLFIFIGINNFKKLNY